MAKLNFSPEVPNDRRTLNTDTKGGAILQITYMDWEPWPQIVCAKLILDYGTASPRIRSITAMMRRNVAMRAAIENEVIAYLELRNEKLQAQMYLEHFDDRKDHELEKFFHERSIN